MKSFQHKSGWLVASIAAAAMLTACAPEFDDDTCISDDDCFANEVCLAYACVVTTQTNDVGNDVEDTTEFDDIEEDIEEDVSDKTDIEIPELNACEGTAELDNEPGDPCGPCNLDEYICDGTENTVCDGATECPEIALVTTNPSDITAADATFHGQIQTLSDDLPTAHGFCWSTDPLPTDSNADCQNLGPLTADDEGDSFEHTVDDLDPGTTYHVRVFHADSTGTVYANVVEFTTLAPFPTNFSASEGTETAVVQLEWDDMPGATEYHVFRDNALLGVVDSDTTSFDDELAEPGTLTAAQNPTASQGTSVTAVILGATAAVASPGSSQPYTIRAKYPDALSAHSPEVDGYRGIGPITYQWERSAAELSQNFSPLAGVTALNTEDTTAPANGDTRFYRVIASAEGAASKTSAAVSGFRDVSSAPALDPVTISDITTTTAKATATIATLGNPPATHYGLCIGTTPNPSADCADLGPPPANDTIERDLTGLSTGTTYHIRAYLTVNDTRHYSSNTSFITLPAAPTAVTASTENNEHVTVSWTAVTGAVSYEILRDGTSLATDVQSPYEDASADAPSPATAPTLTATSDSPLHVKLNWSAATTASGSTHEYTVIAVNADGGKSAASAPATGSRAAHTITSYELQRNNGAWADIGLITTYNDTTAPAPLITPGTISVQPDEPVPGQNTFTVTGHDITDGTSVTYNVRAVTDATNGTPSDDASGHRVAETLSLQWQAKAPSASDFTPIDNETGTTYIDEAPLDQQIQVLFTSTGADPKTSNTLTSDSP